MNCNDCIHREACTFSSVVETANHCRHYEDKSHFIELPCKVGDKVYYIKHASVFEHTIDEINYEFTATENGNIVRGIYFEPKHIGKTVFLTREEAEKKLQEINK